MTRAPARADDPPHPRAWLDDDVEQITPDVHRIVLPLARTALRGVNVYVVSTAQGPLLVDAGWARPETDRALEAGLAQLGLHPRDLTRVVVTHCHHDHYTEALALHERYGVPVSLGQAEAPSIEAFARPLPHLERPDRLRRNGAGALADAFLDLTLRDEAAAATPWGPPQQWLASGERIPLDGRDLEVVETPGHTRGHIVLRDDGAGLLFAGDHVLPHITPSVGYDAALTPYPLRDYLASLHLVRARRDLVLLPAHGPVRPSTHRRVDELLDHHVRRLEEVAARVAAGDVVAHDIARALRWTRRELGFDAIGDVENQALAVLEIEAHLDVLVLAGRLVEQSDDADGIRRFALPASAA